MRPPEIITENPLSKFTKVQVRRHPYLTTAVLSGLVLAGTIYDIFTYVAPISERARQEALRLCDYPNSDELSFANNITSSANPIDKQRANQIEARLQGANQCTTIYQNITLSDHGRRFHVLEFLGAGISANILLLAGIFNVLNRRKQTRVSTSGQ